MDQLVIIINGRGGAGKDTLCACAARAYPCRNISSIAPIVEIARFAGWDGEKTPAARRLLSRLKEAFTEWGDLSFRYCMEAYRAFLDGPERLLFVHIREPAEIARFRDAVGARCRTLLVRRPQAAAPLGNTSDDGVENFPYDFIFENNGPLEGLAPSVHAFLAQVLAGRAPSLWRYPPHSPGGAP